MQLELNGINKLIIQWGVVTSGTAYLLPITLATVYASLALANYNTDDISSHDITTNSIKTHLHSNATRAEVFNNPMAFFVIGN